MADFAPELKQKLKAGGCRGHRSGKGSHDTWYSPASKQYFTVPSKILSRHTANKCLKDAGLYNKKTRFG